MNIKFWPCGNIWAICVLLFFALMQTVSADESVQSDQGKYLPIERVAKHLDSRPEATSLQNARAERDLIGKIYTGQVRVLDVLEKGNDILIECKSWGDHGERFQFLIQGEKLKGKAAELRKKDEIRITAKLLKIWFSKPYINRSGTYYSLFQNVQSIEVLPKPLSEEPK